MLALIGDSRAFELSKLDAAFAIAFVDSTGSAPPQKSGFCLDPGDSGHGLVREGKLRVTQQSWGAPSHKQHFC